MYSLSIWLQTAATRSPAHKVCERISVTLPELTYISGAGAHISSLPPDQVAQVTRLELVTTTFMQNSFTWPKLSLAMTLGKIFSPVRSLKVTLILLAGVLCLFGIALAIATWLQCAPVRRDWDKAVAGTCWNAHVLAGLEIGLSSKGQLRYAGVAQSDICTGYSAFLDVMFAFWPMRLVWHLQTDKKRKILLEILLGLTLLYVHLWCLMRPPISKAND